MATRNNKRYIIKPHPKLMAWLLARGYIWTPDKKVQTLETKTVKGIVSEV